MNQSVSRKWEGKRSAHSVLLLTNAAKKYGFGTSDCLKNTTIDPAILKDPSAEISAIQELQVIENIVDGIGDVPGFALEVGSHYHLTTYGIWGFVFTSSSTLRSAVEFGLRYVTLTFAFSNISLEESGDLACLCLDDADLPEKIKRFVVERDSAAILNIYRELFSQSIPFEAIHFKYPAPKDASVFDHAFGISPKFDQDKNGTFFHRRLLDAALPTANAATRKIFEAQCQRLLQQRESDVGLAHKVRQRLLENIGGKVDMESVAESLGISTRTLRRQLSAEGSSFRTLLEEVREILACELIKTTNLPLEEIALRVGYSETSNFFHAFKRWKGVTPNVFRKDTHG